MNMAANSGEAPAAGGAGGGIFHPRKILATTIPLRTVITGALLVAALWIASWPAINGRFIWQDWHNILDNVLVTSKAGLGGVWYSPSQTHFNPLTKTLFWMEYRSFGDSPLGYHLISLLLASAVVLLIWRLLTRLAIPGAMATALIFAVHPLTLQTTAYISQTGSILATGFLLGGLWLWTDYLDAPAIPWRRVASLTLIVLALLCQPILVAGAPLLLLLLGWWRRGRMDSRMIQDIVPAVVFVIAVVWTTLWFSAPIAAKAHLPLAQRVALSGWTFWFYISKLLWPVDLNLIYKPWSVAAAGFWAYLPLLLAIMLLGVLLWQATRGKPTARAILLGLGFYLLALLPVIGLIKMPWMLYTSAANTLCYLAIIGVLALLCAGLRIWHDRLKPGGRVTLEALGLVVVVLLLTVTNLSARLYQFPAKLWKNTLKSNPQAWPARNNLAHIALKLKPMRVSTARHEAQRAIAINPDDLTARLLLAKLDFGVGATKAGTAQLMEVIKRDPHNARALSHLVGIALSAGHTRAAMRYATQAVKSAPDLPQPNLAMGQVLVETGHLRHALTYFIKAARVAPRNVTAHEVLAAALLHVGKIGPAILTYRSAVKLDPKNIPLRFAYARLLARAGLLDQANEQFHQLFMRRPHSAELYQAYGVFLLRNEVYRRAAKQFQTSLKLNPHNAMAWLQLAHTLKELGQMAQAQACLTKAKMLDPDIMNHLPGQPPGLPPSR